MSLAELGDIDVTVTCRQAGYRTATATSTSFDAAIDVDCAAASDPCDDPLGSLASGTTARSGTITADASCTSPQRFSDGGSSTSRYARRHTFILDAPATVTVDLGSASSNASRLDTYLLLLGGHNAGTGTVEGRNDDRGGGSRDSRIADKRLTAGDYTIEATTFGSGRTGDYDLSVSVMFDSVVTISGLVDVTQTGTGELTVSDEFTVAPVTASCNVTPVTASVTAGQNGLRTLSAAFTVPGSVGTVVRCTAAGRGPAQDTATLAHAGVLSSIAARVIDSGECTATAATGSIDAAYRCTIGRGNTATVAADATATGDTLEVAWSATGGVAVGSQVQASAVAGSTAGTFERTATAELSCTANGAATATVTLPGTTATKTAQLTVTCANAVTITGLADATGTGSGQVTVTRGFTVSPATASCTADPATATVTGTGSSRTLSASVNSPGSLEVTVTCEATGHADGIRQITLTAELACSQHLGTLATGRVERTGTITADTACTSATRSSGSGTYYTRRHTFTLDSPGWVTIDLANAASNTSRLDTYLILLDGHGSAGTQIDSDDDSGNRNDSRLADIFLQRGNYTIEATTYRTTATGNYNLTVDATVTVSRVKFLAQSRVRLV
ncbi:hypothetical protein [Candidatus Poriferisodalis sp.]|uniref:hypothetical protein n=1 Tax=Candidatus Poriferisodalis sp. TaxID=3101277 RepID=UPI003B59F03A